MKNKKSTQHIFMAFRMLDIPSGFHPHLVGSTQLEATFNAEFPKMSLDTQFLKALYTLLMLP
jgi:hypothetical protein